MSSISDDNEEFRAELAHLSKARASWVELALALRDSRKRLSAKGKMDRGVIFESWASRQLGLNEGMLKRYSVVLDFLEKERIFRPGKKASVIPEYVRGGFSAFEIVTRIDKLSPQDAAGAVRQIKEGLASVRGLSQRLRSLAKNHSDTTAVRRSQAAANWPDRLRWIEDIIDAGLAGLCGGPARLHRAVHFPTYIRCHLAATFDNDERCFGFSIVNTSDKRRMRDVEDAMMAAIFSAHGFHKYYIILVEGDAFLRNCIEMVEFCKCKWIGVLQISGGKFWERLRPEETNPDASSDIRKSI